MKFPDGEEMQCWFCNQKFNTQREDGSTISCPTCGEVLKTFSEKASGGKKNKKRNEDGNDIENLYV